MKKTCKIAGIIILSSAVAALVSYVIYIYKRSKIETLDLDSIDEYDYLDDYDDDFFEDLVDDV
ncbi:MAG: hypothetical protein J6A59_09090 [Lachnospiraceae bacterium]|nr:hypothetical protein [Lachnospiraceae bacterium]